MSFKQTLSSSVCFFATLCFFFTLASAGVPPHIHPCIGTQLSAIQVILPGYSSESIMPMVNYLTLQLGTNSQWIVIGSISSEVRSPKYENCKNHSDVYNCLTLTIAASGTFSLVSSTQGTFTYASCDVSTSNPDLSYSGYDYGPVCAELFGSGGEFTLFVGGTGTCLGLTSTSNASYGTLEADFTPYIYPVDKEKLDRS